MGPFIKNYVRKKKIEIKYLKWWREKTTNLELYI